MKPKTKATNQAELPFEQVAFHTPTIRIPQPNGDVLLRPGKPVLVEGRDDVGTMEASRILGLSQRTIEHECAIGIFKTAWKPGGRPLAMWRISRKEVLDRLGVRPD